MLFTIAVFFTLSFTLYAQDSTKSDTKKETKKYQDFVDKNKNGINDKLEEQQKKTAKVEPKRDIEQDKLKSPEAKDADTAQKAKADNLQSTKKKGKAEPKRQKR